MEPTPAAINRLSPSHYRALSAYSLGSPRAKIAASWDERLEVGVCPARLTLRQISIGVVDLDAGAMADVLLMSEHRASILFRWLWCSPASLSASPGTPGSIACRRRDAGALPEFAASSYSPHWQFGIRYFVIPFGIAISILGTRELWLRGGALAETGQAA